MKKLAVILLLLMHTTATSARNFHLYGEAGYGIGNFNSVKLGLHSFFDSTRSISLIFYFNTGKSNKVPADYYEGLDIIHSSWNDPRNMTMTLSATYGFVLHSERIVRYNAKAGISVGKAVTPANFIKGVGLAGPNYDYTYEQKFIAGVLLNPSVEFTIANGWGLTLGLYGNLTYYQPALGVEVTTIFGSLRKSRCDYYE